MIRKTHPGNALLRVAERGFIHHEYARTAAARMLRLAAQHAARSCEEVARTMWTMEALEARVLLSVATFHIPQSQTGSGNGDYGLIAAPGNSMWFLDGTAHAIDHITADGSVAEFPLSTMINGTGVYASVAVGPDGNAWVTDGSTADIDRITPSGDITQFPVPLRGSLPTTVTSGPDGNLSFMESDGSEIGRITPQGQVGELQLPNSLRVDGASMASAYGDIWFLASDPTAFANDDTMLVRVSPEGAISTLTVGGAYSPTAVAAASDGTLWMQDYNPQIDRVAPDGSLTAVALPGAGTAGTPSEAWTTYLAPDPQGGFWFDINNDPPGSGANRIGHLTSAGVIREYTVALAAPDGASLQIGTFTATTDGNLWVMDYDATQIDRIEPSSLSAQIQASPVTAQINGLSSIVGPVATFNDLAGNVSASNYSATLNFGDGISEPGNIAPDPSGGFDVTTGAAWPLGASDVTVTITDTRNPHRDPLGGRTAIVVSRPQDTAWNGGVQQTPMAVDAQGNLWFTWGSGLTRVSSSGVQTPFQFDVPISGPVVGADGNIWFTRWLFGVGRTELDSITPAGVLTENPAPGILHGTPHMLAAGPDGNFWFIDGQGIGRVTPPGDEVDHFPVTAALAINPYAIAATANGIYFLAEDGNGAAYLGHMASDGHIVGVMALPAGSGTPNCMTADASGNVWIGADPMILRVSPDGALSEFPMNDGNNGYGTTQGIAAASDGSVWLYSAGDTNTLTRVTPDGMVQAFKPPALFGALAVWPAGKLSYLNSTDNSLESIDLGDALLGASQEAQAIEGQPQTVTVASFTDFGAGAEASNYTATITWDDGTTSSGAIAPNANGGFDVTATHTWPVSAASSNPYDPTPQAPVTVAITDTRDPAVDPLGGRSTLVASFVDVSQPSPPVPVGTAYPISATAGQLFSGVVASFSNVDPSAGTYTGEPGAYSVGIDWGNGQSTDGTLTVNSQGGFDVSGSNRFAQSGVATVTVSLWRGTYYYPGGFMQVAVVSTTATVAPGAMEGTGYTLTALDTGAFSGQLAHFQLADPSTDLSHLHAVVTWNDWGNTPPVANAPITSDGNGGFYVSAAADLPTAPSSFVVTISDDRLGAGDSAIVGVAYGPIVDAPSPPNNSGGNAGGGTANNGDGLAGSGTPGTPNSGFIPVTSGGFASVADGTGSASGGDNGSGNAYVWRVWGSVPASSAPPGILMDWGDGQSPLDTLPGGDQGLLDPTS